MQALNAERVIVEKKALQEQYKMKLKLNHSRNTVKKKDTVI